MSNQAKYRIMKRGKEYCIEEFRHFKKSKRRERRTWGHLEYHVTIREAAHSSWIFLRESIQLSAIYGNTSRMLAFTSRAQAVAHIRKEFGECGVSQIKQPEWQEC